MSSEARNGLRERLLLEVLEDRMVMDHDPSQTAGSHIHARLSIFVDGQRVIVPKDVGVGTGLIAPVHTHDVSGKLHIEPEESTYQLSPAGRFAVLGDFFDAWRLHGGNAGNNPNAVFNSTTILGHQADANHVIRFFVNGVPNTEFENYILRDNDEIAILYDTVQSGASASGPMLMPIDNYYTTTSSGTTVTWGRNDRVDLLSGSPLYLPLDGYDPNGQAITYTVSSDNPNITTYIPQSNRTLRMHVTNYGTMTFQLFDDKAPRVTDHIAQLAQSGFFNGITFHRVIDNFVIQGGDPTGTGSGGSQLGDFDDQFHFDLQHNRTGLLSMAKSSDDTNDSQFFITDQATRSLDFNHSIFGMLTQGDYIRDQINSVATNSSDKPLVNVVMDSVTIVNDIENGALMLKAAAGYTGSGHITVTARDSDGNTMTRTFTVNVTPDTIDGGPFLNDFNTNITTPHATVATGQVTSVDIENSAVFYDAAPASVANGWDFTINNTTGAWTFTPQSGFAGVFSQLVGVRPNAASGTGQGFDFDIEEIFFTVTPPANATIGNLYSVNVQTPEELLTTKPTGFAYSLVGAPAGMTINSSTGVLSWTPAAGQNGTFNFEVRTTDTDGNIGTPARTMQFSVTTPGGVSVPSGVDLAAASDSGASNTDNITNVTLPQFVVSGVTSGSTVRLYDGTTVIGQAVAASSTVTITPTSALSHGVHSISASQQSTGGSETARSTALGVTVDTALPSNFSTNVANSAGAGFGYVFDVENPDETSASITYSLQNAPTGLTIAAGNGLLTWAPTAAQVGIHNFVISATDSAGNVRTQNASITVQSENRQAMPDFHLTDVNPTSPRANQSVSPRDYLNQISVWYLIHST